MTTANTTPKASQSTGRFRMPDPPERQPDEVTSFDHLSATGSVRYLIEHFGDPGTTIVSGEHYITPSPTTDTTGVKYPDLAAMERIRQLEGPAAGEGQREGP